MELSIDQALQRGSAAHESGDMRIAEHWYRSVLIADPGNAEANHNLGLLAIDQGSIDDALAFFVKAIRENPNKEVFWVNYIRCLIIGSNFDDAQRMLDDVRQAGLSVEALDPLERQLVDAQSGTGIVEKRVPSYLAKSEQQLGRKKRVGNKKQLKGKLRKAIPAQDTLDRLLLLYQSGALLEAKSLAISLTREFPGHQAGWKVLGHLLKQLGRPVESLAPSYRSVELSPRDAEAQNNLGSTLLEIGRLAEAKACFRRAIKLEKDYVEAHYNLGLALKKTGDLAKAAESFRRVLSLQPDFLDSPELLLQCLYSEETSSVFLDHLTALIAQNQVSATIGSMVGRAKLKFGIQLANPFCEEPLNYVVHRNLAESCDFEELCIGPVKNLLANQQFGDRSQSLLVNGSQTAGNIFALGDPGLDEIEKAIRQEIEQYRSEFADSRDGLISRWPSNYALDGWVVSMQTGGSLMPHIHERSWLSGSLYINVPPKADPDCGNLKVAVGVSSDVAGTIGHQETTVNVSTGSLVLFPASVMHHTVPFQSEQDRIVLAFDTIPQ